MRHHLTCLVVVALSFIATPVFAQAKIKLSPADEAAAFRAAGFKRVGRTWQGCGDPGTMSYSPGTFESVRDINGDGRLDAVIVESSTYCYGMTGTGFSLVSKQANGSWRVINASQGIATFQPRGAKQSWPDIEIGGPGFCFSVQRWNGRQYVHNRYQYEGKRCRPPQ